jgi:hypothetical protein
VLRTAGRMRYVLSYVSKYEKRGITSRPIEFLLANGRDRGFRPLVRSRPMPLSSVFSGAGSLVVLKNSPSGALELTCSCKVFPEVWIFGNIRKAL